MTKNTANSEQHAAASRRSIHSSVLDKLDPAFVRLYTEHIEPALPRSDDINIIRHNYSTLYLHATAPASGVGGIGETQVPGWDKYPGDVNVRVYVPPGEEPGTRKVWPVHFNFHGGGWAAGDLETDAHMCHHICAAVPCCVIDIEYRLVPEFPFPIGIMDAFAAVSYILSNYNTFSIDPKMITLGGSSSGGTIALVLNHLVRDTGIGDKLRGVVVGTPIIGDTTKYASPEQSPWSSAREFQHAPLLDWDTLKWYDGFRWMPPASDAKSKSKQSNIDMSWFINALDAPNFERLAPLTWIATAEIDPTRDEAEAYAKKLRDAGNKVVLKRYKGVPHPFIRMDKTLTQAQDYVQDVISHIRICLHPSESSVALSDGSEKY